MDEPERRLPGEDAAPELKRLRRENEILRQERDILKRANVFFAKDGLRPERHRSER
jgi:transposase